MKENQPRILAVDIEWKPAKVYAWQAYDVNVGPNQIIDEGGLLCVAAQFIGEKEMYFFSEWEDGPIEMGRKIAELITQADAVTHYNGDRYDMRKLQGHMLRWHLPPLPPVTSIDCLKTVKQQGFYMNKLAFIGPFLGLGKKIDNGGFDLWLQVEAGNPQAQKKMRRYCIQDVRLLVKLYNRIKPYVKTHPHLGYTSADACPVCGSTHVQKRGVTRTRSFVTQRLHCQTCSHWFSGTRKKL